MSTIAVIIPAAGLSIRFGGLEKKPFVSLEGRPIWQRAAELFWNRADVSKVYLVINPDDRDDFRRRFGHLIAFANVQLVNGGAERFESVANALDAVPGDVDLIAVHDAVRPLTPTPLIDAVFASAAEHGAALLAMPLADTLKQVDAATQTVSATLPRAGLWQAQTPQVFRRDWLRDAYAQRSSLPASITDDAQLVDSAGHPVRVVAGSPINFKITTKDDLALAEAILKAREAKPVERPARAFDDEAKW
jgi:2-C-methyl-D-erythritol 4-phosphate cytidylyltransferase